MSDQFYDYLSEKLLNYFVENKIPIGERYLISFDKESKVVSFYKSLKKVAKEKSICSKFPFTHDDGTKEYITYAININGVKLVVSESSGATDYFLNTLRNELKRQENDWKNSALLIICTQSIESIFNAMKDLQEEGMPLNVKEISKNLKEEIEYSELTPSEKAILNFSLDTLEDSQYETTLWEYRPILSIIKKAEKAKEGPIITDNDFQDLNLFKDDQLNKIPPEKWNKRLKENYETFREVSNYSKYGEKKEQLGKMFSKRGVEVLSKDDWYTKEWRLVKKYKDDKKPKEILEYIPKPNPDKISENGLPYWERPNSSKGAGNRRRNIIVFNNNSSSKVSLKFEFDKKLDEKYLTEPSKKICKTDGKFLLVDFDLNPNEPTFKSVKYEHKNQTSSTFTFPIAVLNFRPKMIETIKSRFAVNSQNKKIVLMDDEDGYDIVFGIGSEETAIPINKDSQSVYLHDDEPIKILIAEDSSIWGKEEVNFTLHYHKDFIPFVIKEKTGKSEKKESWFLWNLKRINQKNCIFNDVTAVQDENSFPLYDEFKKFLKMEREIIEKRIFYAKRNNDGSLEKDEDISFNKDLEKAYLEILNYYYNYDNSPSDNLPSLFYLSDELKEKYEKFIDLFNEEISQIEDGDILSEFNEKKDLLKLGRVDIGNDKKMYSPLSPLNIAYQLEVAKQCGNEDLPENISKRLVPNNLIPYIYSDEENDLFRPVYQEDAHEWLIYEKNDEVSIGTTNAFISDVVTEKLNQFVKHFEYLFTSNSPSPIKINLINIKNDKEVVKGIFNFIKSKINHKGKIRVIPVEINIFNSGEKSYFDTLLDCQSVSQLDDELGIKNIKIKNYDPIDVIHIIQDNISYYKHPFKKGKYEYAHISFYKVISSNDLKVDNDMDTVETGLSLNGLLSSVSSKDLSSGYRLGFGTKNTPKEKNTLTKTAINLNELAENSKASGGGTYSKNKSISSIVELKKDNIEELYEKSHWVTFIEPTFGIEFFDKEDTTEEGDNTNKEDNDLIIINSSDQYSSSTKYDTITVTGDSTLYKEIIRDFLKSKDVPNVDEELHNIIKIFNAINGEWLLRIISNSGQYDREKLSIISAIKYCLAILDHDDIVWIPVSMEEILRIAGNVKLDRDKGIFDSNLIKGVHSDDLLFIGVKFNEDKRLEVIFYPIEVKIGKNKSSTMKKGKMQLDKTYHLLRTELRKTDNEGTVFRNKFFRNFFIQILLSNERKLSNSHIWPKKHLDRLEDEEVKCKLLNDEYDIIYGLEKFIGIGSLVSFKEDSYHSHIYKLDSNKQVIELPEEFAYYGLATPIEQIHHEIQSDETDILAESLLSHKDIRNISVKDNDSYDFDDEYFDDEENFEEDLIDDEPNYSAEENGDISDLNSEVELTEDVEHHSSENSRIRALIGTQEGYKHKVYWEFGHLKNKHMLIQGKSGEGKTYFIQRMLKELSNQGIPTIIIDYTDGFRIDQLEPAFLESLEDKIEEHVVFIDRFPLNPFKKYNKEYGGKVIPQDDSDVASRFKSIIKSVYNLGDVQEMVIYNAVLSCLKKHGENFNFAELKQELKDEDTKESIRVLTKLIELFDFNPFDSENEFSWENALENSDGKITIIQLTNISKDIQKVITEIVLRDLWNYKKVNGSKDNPFIVVLDEFHNLDLGPGSPSSLILKEGRRYGWSGWFATQSIQGYMKSDVINDLNNVGEKIYFHPTNIPEVAKVLANEGGRKKMEEKLNQLTNGNCIVQGPAIDSNGKLYYPPPITVKIDEITTDKN